MLFKIQKSYILKLKSQKFVEQNPIQRQKDPNQTKLLKVNNFLLLFLFSNFLLLKNCLETKKSTNAKFLIFLDKNNFFILILFTSN